MEQELEGDINMLFKDNRGFNKKQEANINKNIVFKWYKKNKDGTAIQCSKDTGLSYKTVLKWTRVIREDLNGKAKKDRNGLFPT